MPPATRANNATLSAPSEKPVSVSSAMAKAGLFVAVMPAGRKCKKNRMNSPPRPSMASPVTPMPMTVPPAKEILKALARLVRAACAVLTLACVAIFMPIQPARAENMAPMMNATTMSGWVCSPVMPRYVSKRLAMTTK